MINIPFSITMSWFSLANHWQISENLRSISRYSKTKLKLTLITSAEDFESTSRPWKIQNRIKTKHDKQLLFARSSLWEAIQIVKYRQKRGDEGSAAKPNFLYKKIMDTFFFVKVYLLSFYQTPNSNTTQPGFDTKTTLQTTPHKLNSIFQEP